MNYVVSGATSRSGTGTDASGSFNVGESTITWTATDANGNTSTCTTTVTIGGPISGTIADVYAVNPGGLPNTIYIGYGPSSLTLTATPSGGAGGYTFTWSNGATTPSITVNPSAP